MSYPKRMKSPDGGFTHVYSVGEESQIRSHGWIAEDEAQVAVQTDAVVPDEPAVARRGRKPKNHGADDVQ